MIGLGINLWSSAIQGGGGGGLPQPNEIPWTPLMASPRVWLDASDASTLLNTSGVQAAVGEAVETWSDKSGSNNHAVSAANSAGASTAATRGVVGASEVLGPTTVTPLRMGNGVTTHRYITPAGSFGMASGSVGDALFTVARIRPPATAVTRTLIGSNQGSFVTHIGTSISTAQGQVHAANAAGAVKTDTATRLEILSQVKASATGNNWNLRLNGTEVLGPNGGGSSLALASGRMTVGNVYNGSQGADADMLAVVILPAGYTRANVQRLEGYYAHRFGIASLLPADHPYKAAAPTVPVGTTTTAAAQAGNLVPSTFQQTWMGGMYEGQIDSYEGGFSVPPTDTEPAVATASYKWGVPYSYTASGARGLAGLRAYLFGGLSLRPVATLLRFPLGFAYRGARLVNAISGLIERFGERYPGQNAAVSALMSEVVPLGGGLCPSFWTLPPHWTTAGSISGNPANYIWAGGSYPRSTRLDTLFDGDATALADAATQIGLLTDMIVELLEYLHQNVAPVRMFALQNEAGNPANAYYGHIHYSAREYVAVLKRTVEKIRASSILSTYGGQPNTVRIIGNSWDGAASQPTVVTDTEVLNTGKTLFQEHFALATHGISSLNTNADNAKTEINNVRSGSVAAANPNYPIMNDEYWGRDNTTDTEDWEAINSLLKTAHFIVRGKAATDCFVIHAGKPVGQIGDTGATNAKAYGATFFRRPAPFDQDPTTPGDPRPDIGYGEWAANPRYGMSQQAWKYLRPGSKILTAYNGENAARRQTVFALDPDNKLVVIRINGSTTEDASPIDFGKARVMKGYRFGNNVEGTDIATVNASLVGTATPAERADVWVEQ